MIKAGVESMTRLAGSKVLAVDFQLPDVVTAFGDGTNTITATSFTDLPTTSCVAAITNPHPTASLICLVEFGAWMSRTTGGAIRCCPRVSGSTTIAAGIGAGGPLGWGEVPLCGNNANPQQMMGGGTYTLPVSATAATLTMQAMVDSAGTGQVCNYPTIRIIPLYYAL
jgi:hypothetical protein